MADSIDCKAAKERLQDFLRQELTPELEIEMREHIDRCKHCFTHYRFEANFLVMLETRATREFCPEKLRQRIIDLLRAEAQRG